MLHSLISFCLFLVFVSCTECFAGSSLYADQSTGRSHPKPVSLEQFKDDSLDSVERLMIDDIADSMGLTSLTDVLTEEEARQVLREKLEQTEQETSPEDSSPPSSSETGTLSSEASRDFAPGIMMMVLGDERRGSSSTETSEDSCRQTTDSLSSRTSPHIHAILEKHLRGRRRKSLDAMSQSSSCQSYTTLPDLHIYEEVYGESNAVNASYLQSRDDSTASIGLPTAYYSRRLQQLRSSSMESARQRSNIYSLMKESRDRQETDLPSNPLESRRRPFILDPGYGFEASV